MKHRILSARRALVCVAVGVVAGGVAAVAVSPDLAPLVAWCTAGVIALVWVWRICWRQDPAGTERVAREESASPVTDNAIITACFASIAAVVIALMQSSNQNEDPGSVALVILGVLGTIVAWALVNTVYALKYARMHYVDHPNDGFDIKHEARPTYSDFAYFAFTVGMSYAAPEVEPNNSETRRKALLHALLSYFFGTVLIAVSINLVTNLGQG
ncbi:DUF1345 domain-containing protein [Pseudarthrobacter phenanthrenivorans]|uniref:DUF1345 domain-containing protein n=1 Tax=Pseudarthrobacter phenanthrenivorans TaxID=361575 RepID=A0A3B0G670_PSEPS|nr:DUF1345 domain-containing protein [Pseudarthrobacter phenanthrenivorans]RKO27528.1 DUF1345 domain-containing protein [Pseudarthrobacter phenanthrenivorans]